MGGWEGKRERGREEDREGVTEGGRKTWEKVYVCTCEIRRNC